jgi:hypothetical protein
MVSDVGADTQAGAFSVRVEFTVATGKRVSSNRFPRAVGCCMGKSTVLVLWYTLEQGKRVGCQGGLAAREGRAPCSCFGTRLKRGRGLVAKGGWLLEREEHRA